MGERQVDLSTWSRADQFRFFREFDRPHYAITTRIDVSHIMTRRARRGMSPYRACLFGIGAGLHAVPALCMRFRGDVVVQHDALFLSMTVPRADGGFNYAYVPFHPDFAVFDTSANTLITDAKNNPTLGANDGTRDDVAYLSCLPWMDYSGLNNAMPGQQDCIPRVSWGRIVEPAPGRFDMAMTIEVHHALVDGGHVGAYFAAVQSALNRL